MTTFGDNLPGTRPRIAILHQGLPAPEVDGVVKPMKPNGYRDSAADIGYVLRERHHDIVTPDRDPDPLVDEGWSFPDTERGIAEAFGRGASAFWANTVLYSGHALEKDYGRPFLVVGQPIPIVQRWEDKFETSQALLSRGLSVARTHLIKGAEDLRSLLDSGTVTLPVVVKPVRGRGSEGVVVVSDVSTARTVVHSHLTFFIDSGGVCRSQFGDRLIVEEFLPGPELTLTVMPPGRYQIEGREQQMDNYWALPPVERIGHHEGVAPYSGVLAVVRNSRVVGESDRKAGHVTRLTRECESAAGLVGATAPVRIDCRADKEGRFRLFDVNFKPNMTGAGRPSREDQDSLSCLAARAIGWNYGDLLEAMLANACSNRCIAYRKSPLESGPSGT
jgi:D-alanine-D-alanine ligase